MSRQSPAALRPGNMRPSLPLSVLATSVTSAAALVSYTPPSCSLDGLKIGAGLGSVAGAVGGVLRAVPSNMVRPVILGAAATTNLLDGVKNQISPDQRVEEEEKWKTYSES